MAVSIAISRELTARAFAGAYADVPFCELERGEVICLTAGGWGHSAICVNITSILRDWARRSKRGRVLGNEAGVVTQRDPDTVRGVDAAYISYKRLPKGKEPAGFTTVPPNLVVEVVGKGQSWKKMLEKASEYFRMGVDRVWIVDPRTETVHVLRPDAEPLRLTVQDTIRNDDVLPGFGCRVAEFFDI